MVWVCNPADPRLVLVWVEVVLVLLERVVGGVVGAV